MRFEAGVWDPVRRAVFVAGNRVMAGGALAAGAPQASPSVESIDIATGAVRWRTSCAGLPVAVAERQLVVVDRPPQAAALTLRLLETGDGTIAAEYRLPLPAWTVLPRAIVDIESVTLSGVLLTLVWHGTSVYGGGAAPPPEVVAANARDQRGAFRIDLQRGTIDAMPAPAPQAVSAFAVDSSGHWRAVDASGAILAEGRGAPGERAVALAGDTLLSLRVEWARPSAVARSGVVLLTARRPDTSQELWQHPLRDLTAPPPPPP